MGCILVSSNVSSIVTCPVRAAGLIASGMLLGAAAMTYLTQLTVTSSYRLTCCRQLVMGLGFGMIFAGPSTPPRRRPARGSGVASALVNTMQQVGGSIGTSALSTIALTATASDMAATHGALDRRSRPPTEQTIMPNGRVVESRERFPHGWVAGRSGGRGALGQWRIIRWPVRASTTW